MGWGGGLGGVGEVGELGRLGEVEDWVGQGRWLDRVGRRGGGGVGEVVTGKKGRV